MKVKSTAGTGANGAEEAKTAAAVAPRSAPAKSAIDALPPTATAGLAPVTDPSELWAALTTLPRPSRIVDYPRKVPMSDEAIGQIAIVPATQQEQVEAIAAAEQYTRAILADPKSKEKELPKGAELTQGYEDMRRNALACELLYRVCRHPNDVAKPIFPGAKWMRLFVTADEMGVLMSHYLRVQAEIGPIVAFLTEEECDAWLDKLEEGGERFPLDLLSSGAKDDLIWRSVARSRNSRTAISSPGSPPGGGLNGTPSGSGTAPPPVDEPPSVDLDEPAAKE